MMKRFLLTLALVFFLAIPAYAVTVPILDFNMDAVHPETALISYAGGAAPLVGVDISVDSITGINTPIVFGPKTIPGATLEFQTGNLTSYTNGIWTFDGGGYIRVDWLGTNLLYGAFNNAQVTGGDKSFSVIISNFFDTKCEEMLSDFGLPDVTYVGNMNLSFIMEYIQAPNDFVGALAFAGGPAFRSNPVLSGDITNQPVPEPMTMLLLGTGLVGVAGASRRKFKK